MTIISSSRNLLSALSSPHAAFTLMIRSSRLRFRIPPGNKGIEQSQVPTTRGCRSIAHLRCHTARYI
ncbi:RAS-related protein raba1f [Phtheirospermum japonicum]|uniref:RAS-related protein raba1f n=1 Tax=Phtheirospermum japonicum TaxID=374723 RepID=A0A830C9I0_9LAMI|nr:RAS-related protein raba1f [Phtheirospermum japonicum]